MESFSEIIPFAKEMLKERPSRSMLKIYMLGSTVAMLGMVGGLVETIILPFVEKDTFEDEPVELIMENEKEKKQVLKSHPALVHTEVVDVLHSWTLVSVVALFMSSGSLSSQDWGP
uniref:G0/G1 switch 2 n=1 Tax=Stegastes partitus TaxID=144197 RepID=A0A3B4Z2Z4_9TELE